MSLIQNRAAVAPLNGYFSMSADAQPVRTPSVAEMVAKLRPEEPLHCVRPETITNASQRFCATPSTATFCMR